MATPKKTTTTKPKAQPKATKPKPEADQIDWLTEGKTVEEEKLPVVAAQPSFMIAQRDENMEWPMEAVKDARAFVQTVAQQEPQLSVIVAELIAKSLESSDEALIVARDLANLLSHTKNHGWPRWWDDWINLIAKGGRSQASIADQIGIMKTQPWLFFNRANASSFSSICSNLCTARTRDTLVDSLYERALDKTDKASITALIFALKQIDPSFRDSIAVQNQTNLNMVSTGDNSSWAIIPSNPDQSQK
jgi:hypothetical protein